MRHTCLLSSIAAVFLIYITDWLRPYSVPKDKFCFGCCHQAVPPRWSTEFLEAPRHSISFRLRLVNSPLNREHRGAGCILFLNCEEIYLDAWDFLKILLKFLVSGAKTLIVLAVKLSRPGRRSGGRGDVVCVGAALTVSPAQDSQRDVPPRQKPQASWCRTVTTSLTARHTNHVCFYFSSLGRNRC